MTTGTREDEATGDAATAPRLLYSARDAKGDKVAGRIAANDLASARALLEANGHTAIEFHTDAYMERLSAGVVEFPEGLVVTPEDEVAARTAPKRHFLVGLLKSHGMALLVLGGWAAYGAATDPSGWLSILGYVLCAAYVVMIVMIIAPSIVFDRMLLHFTWGRHREAARCLATFRRLPKLVKVADHMLDHYEAKALVGDGRVDEAYALYARHEASLPRTAYLSQRGSLEQSALDFARAEATYRELYEIAPEESAHAIELATLLARVGGHVDEAEALLDGVDDATLIPLARGFACFARGLVRLDQGRHPEAIACFTEALEAVHPLGANVLVDYLRALFQGNLAIPVLALGRRREAERLWRPVLKRLQATRCIDATGRFAAVAAGRPFEPLR